MISCEHIGRVTSLRVQTLASADVIVDSVIIGDVTQQRAFEVVVDGAVTDTSTNFDVTEIAGGVKRPQIWNIP